MVAEEPCSSLEAGSDVGAAKSAGGFQQVGVVWAKLRHREEMGSDEWLACEQSTTDHRHRAVPVRALDSSPSRSGKEEPGGVQCGEVVWCGVHGVFFLVLFLFFFSSLVLDYRGAL